VNIYLHCPFYSGGDRPFDHPGKKIERKNKNLQKIKKFHPGVLGQDSQIFAEVFLLKIKRLILPGKKAM